MNGPRHAYSACIEWLFADAGASLADRVYAAARAGIDAVELWCWDRHDLDALEGALAAAAVALNSFHVEPHRQLTDPSTHREFLPGVLRSCQVARRLGARKLVVFSGATVSGMSSEHQLAAVTTALRDAASVAADFDIELLLEPLNTTDSPGYFAASTATALRILQRVDRPNVRLQFDAYHSAMEGEDPLAVLPRTAGLVGHVQVSDLPGRRPPGQGDIDWSRVMRGLVLAGYDGSIGLEYRPSGDPAELSGVVRLLDEARAAAAG